MAKSALDAAGIDAELIDAETARLNWLYTQAIGGIKLVVRFSESERALEVLHGIWTEDPLPPAAAEPQPQPQIILTCPECQSANVQKIPRLLIFSFIAVLLYGASVALGHAEIFAAAIGAIGLVFLFAPGYRCQDCGSRF